LSSRLSEDGTRCGKEQCEYENGQYLVIASPFDLRRVPWLKFEENKNGDEEQYSCYDRDECADEDIKATWRDKVNCFVACLDPMLPWAE